MSRGFIGHNGPDNQTPNNKAGCGRGIPGEPRSSPIAGY